ncbi:MAG TPA: hypothetical protein VIH22_03405, partial [Cyclobacteriaceae bacterium]
CYGSGQTNEQWDEGGIHARSRTHAPIEGGRLECAHHFYGANLKGIRPRIMCFARAALST